MSFDIRCPECKAKLRLDEAPDPDTPIECPRCGSQFAPPDDAAPAPKPGRKGGGKAKGKRARGDNGNVPKKRKAIKKKVNPFVLVALIMFAFAGLIGVGATLIYFANKAGNVEEMLTYVPDSCNWARGVNVGTMAKYPGYQSEVDKFYTSDIKWAADELADAAGHNKDNFLSYLIIAKNNTGGGIASTMYVFRTMKSFEPTNLGANLKGARDNGDGSYAISGGSGLLSGSVVYMPTRRVIVVIPAGGSQRQLLSASMEGKKGKDGTFAGHLDDTGRVVIRGCLWLLIRQTGGLKNYAADTLEPLKTGLKSIHDRALKSNGMFGVWTTPGGSGVRFGVAMQCESSKDASDLVKAMQDGPLGKYDESEPTNDMRNGGLSFTSDKKVWSEMMQFLRYKSKGACAYLVSDVTGENSRRILGQVNNPSMGTGGSGQGGGRGGPGGPPGGFAPPAGGGRGLPGGVAPPGGVGPGS